MSNYRLNDEYGPSDWSASKLVGILLTMFGAGVILWTMVEIFQLFTQGSAFIVLDDIVPARIELVEGGLFLPREILVYGLPIWAFSVTSKIGVMLLKSGLEFVERPRRVGK
ncbi:MAG: hypothetical protein ACOYZ6_06040 [Chloroflexota bacterium]